MDHARSSWVLGSSVGFSFLAVFLFAHVERGPVLPGRGARARYPPILTRAFEAEGQAALQTPGANRDEPADARVQGTQSAQPVETAQAWLATRARIGFPRFAGCDCFLHALRVRFVGVDARVIEAGEIGILIPTSDHDVLCMLSTNSLQGPQDPVYETELWPGVPARVEIYAWDSRQPIWTTVLNEALPCRTDQAPDENRDAHPDLVVDLTPFLHVREIRLLDGELRPIAGCQAAFRAAGSSDQSFAFEGGRGLLVFSATGSEIRGKLEAAGFRDRDMRFFAHPGRCAEAVELQPGFEVELRALGLRFLDGDRFAGLYVQASSDRPADSKAITTLGTDVRGESLNSSFYFPRSGIVRLRLPHAGKYSAHPLIGQRVGTGIQLVVAAEKSQTFVVAASDDARQMVRLDAGAWNALGE